MGPDLGGDRAWPSPICRCPTPGGGGRRHHRGHTRVPTQRTRCRLGRLQPPQGQDTPAPQPPPGDTEDTGTGWPRPLPRHLLLPAGPSRGAAPLAGGHRHTHPTLAPPRKHQVGGERHKASGEASPPILCPPLPSVGRHEPPAQGGGSALAKARTPPRPVVLGVPGGGQRRSWGPPMGWPCPPAGLTVHNLKKKNNQKKTIQKKRQNPRNPGDTLPGLGGMSHIRRQGGHGRPGLALGVPPSM